MLRRSTTNDEIRGAIPGEGMWWARTGNHKGPIPTSTSSPAPTIYGLGGPLRRIVGASGERMWGVGPCGRPSGVQFTPTPLFEMYWGQAPPLHFSRQIHIDELLGKSYHKHAFISSFVIADFHVEHRPFIKSLFTLHVNFRKSTYAINSTTTR